MKIVSSQEAHVEVEFITVIKFIINSRCTKGSGFSILKLSQNKGLTGKPESFQMQNMGGKKGKMQYH